MLNHVDKYSKAFSKKAYEDLKSGKIPQNEMWKYSSFYYQDFDAMACKTMLRQLISKWGIMSIDMVTAFESDYTVEAADGTRTYVELEDPAVAKLPEQAVDEPVVEEAPAETQPEAGSEDGGDLEWD